ncbi:DNA nucleotidylexotransferase-like [Sinocyclocheilus anshuiensis]|uniref:DNA nucleotidylexotransferase-like n=1 Tax=Sinocyclocheilus anshuiensis TaxID=1608454 RepID=UPI0007BA1041|nr:PREDICTED: DNA nucleotidylexotransferase-like [Sinocyclocheilus anshuiensis]
MRPKPDQTRSLEAWKNGVKQSGALSGELQHTRSSVTHVVSENNSGDEVQAWLDNQTGRDASSSVHLLDTRWFSESMEAGHPVIVQDRHILKVNPKPSGDPTAMLMKSYACQR